MLSNKQYDILKWVISIFIPALIVFSGTLLNIFNYTYTEQVIQILAAIELFLGSIFKISDYNYHKGDGNNE